MALIKLLLKWGMPLISVTARQNHRFIVSFTLLIGLRECTLIPEILKFPSHVSIKIFIMVLYKYSHFENFTNLHCHPHVIFLINSFRFFKSLVIFLT